MSVKKRLLYSHISLYVLPLLTYLLFSTVADGLGRRYLSSATFYSLADLYQKMRMTQLAVRGTVLLGMVAVLLLMNHFLTQGVLRKIESSLDQLSGGLRQLREGNLAVRLPMSHPAEFSVLRADFNATAAQLQQLVEQQQQSERNRRELLAGISHDLRSPLTAIRAYAEGLLDGVARDAGQQEQYLTIIRDKAREMQALVHQLFLFSRMDLGQNQDHPEPVCLKDELSLLCGVLASEYAEKGMTLTLSAPETEGQVLADPDTLHRIVSNIVENSCKYQASRLEISLTEAPEYLSIIFSDDGPGVPQKALPHIFDAFYRADPARCGKISGSGLGLAIVSRAVRNMKGRIIARPAQPHGLELEIQLPRYTPQDQQTIEEASPCKKS